MTQQTYRFNELPYQVQTEVHRILTTKIRSRTNYHKELKNWNNSFILYSIYAVDTWINCNNLNLSKTEWIQTVQEAVI